MPASRFRVHPIAGALSSEGWDTQIIHGYGLLDHKISSPFVRRGYRAACRARRAMRTACLDREGPVVVQRLALPWLAAPEVRLAQRGKQLVFDFDDAVFLGGNGKVNPLRRKALDAVFAAASHVVAGNSWLAQSVNADVQVSVIPTCIDTRKYRPCDQQRRPGPVRIGWIGTSGNFPYLKQLVDPLARLRAKEGSFEFVICSDESNIGLFRELGATFEKWSPERELPFLQSLDIGLMPLADDNWCRGKCSFKMIQYMAVGCPVVASAVGMNIDVIRDGVGGRLVADADWIEPLVAMMQSEELRKITGAQARERAVTRYDTSVAVTAYRAILEGLQ